MRVFLIQTAKGLFSSSGGYKTNYALLRYLSSAGHRVRQLCYSHCGEIEAYLKDKKNNGDHLRTRILHMRPEDGRTGVNVKVHKFYMDDGVEVVALDSEAFDEAFGGKMSLHSKLSKMSAEYIETGTCSPPLLEFISFLHDEIRRFHPTHIISNDGLSMQVSFDLDLADLNMSRIAVVHTAEQLPFGPFAFGIPGQSSTVGEVELLRRMDGVWSVSQVIKDYALEHGQLQSRFLVHHPWTYLVGDSHEIPKHLSNWDKPYIAMVNPCHIKGASIFVDLAKACPQYDFLAFMSWGASEKVVNQIKAQPNITTRPSCVDAEDLWRDIKILIVPSLWCEAWGMVVVEAHLRGIPVVASNAGAVPEAMLGLDYIIPVNAISGEHDETGCYIIPEQDIQPWARVVTRLMEDKSEYEKTSLYVRNVTQQWLESRDITEIERWMMGMGLKLGARGNGLMSLRL
ncbi:uncharacterized protein FIESC28_05341 [Fusarium coffeatum]|uniref:Glycosyl transferase family 1 domain-containing protein n=1 Tax=Fusarium coffeatum TaxID=231269 RepID=A0A366RTD9_9HYPO|nr:uncharacterized protein FIESC28_05341 [Fusarium coffeatum]RBR20062.1 hypothetical protein FIESC28_05341 [Fusarium coffeatum]